MPLAHCSWPKPRGSGFARSDEQGWQRVSGLRTVPYRMLHALRRRRARAALRRHPRVRSVLVVCHGNLCRSSFAAGLLRSWLSSRGVRVESAGFVQPARPSPPEAVAAAARYGVDLSAHRSELLSVDGARAADLIVVMDSGQRRRVCDRVGRSEHDVPRPGRSRPGLRGKPHRP